MISIKSSGSFPNTTSFFDRILRGNIFDGLERFGQMGVDALSNATPKDSGETASGWRYRIVKQKNRLSIEWYNINIVNGANIAVLIQYGHGTGTGGYVEGRDYINPSIRPIFDQIAEEVWKKVKS